MKRRHIHIDNKAKCKMTVIYGDCRNSLIAYVFNSFPLALKQHCIKVGTVAGLMAERIPDKDIPDGLTREEYVCAVRYGGFYHDIGVYLACNDYEKYPAMGHKFLSEQISDTFSPMLMRQLILDIVIDYQKRGDSGDFIMPHAGICSVADCLDMHIAPSKGILRGTFNGGVKMIRENIGKIFTLEAAKCFEMAEENIFNLYQKWKTTPPYWRISDLNPFQELHSQIVG